MNLVLDFDTKYTLQKFQKSTIALQLKVFKPINQFTWPVISNNRQWKVTTEIYWLDNQGIGSDREVPRPSLGATGNAGPQGDQPELAANAACRRRRQSVVALILRPVPLRIPKQRFVKLIELYYHWRSFFLRCKCFIVVFVFGFKAYNLYDSNLNGKCMFEWKWVVNKCNMLINLNVRTPSNIFLLLITIWYSKILIITSLLT